MIVTHLLHRLSETLSDADEIWCAVAMVNDQGFEAIQSVLPEQIKQHLLIGIDLPTTISVLKSIELKCKVGSFEARICRPGSGIFHPKLYLIRKGQQYTAFVGSANLTSGGLNKNLELNFEIGEQEACKELLTWFNTLYRDAFPVNRQNIDIYEKNCSKFIQHNEEYDKPPKIELVKSKSPGDPLGNIEFTDRYFKAVHHLAFIRANWRDTSPKANNQRKNVSDRFLQLHESIYPQFKDYGLQGLYPNVPHHVVSMPYHFPGQTQQDLAAMWLSYGKSQDEIKEYHKLFPAVGRKLSDDDDKQSFINHARLQIRIELGSIGIWILFGKNNGGSMFDRDHFKKSMLVKEYRESFYTKLKSLPEEYWIIVSNNKRFAQEFPDADTLHKFCKQDRIDTYFIIGRDYQISDDAMSQERLPEEVLDEFKRLYPIYKSMRHYL